MANPVSSLIDSAVRATAPVVDGITDDQLTGPTPCAGFDGVFGEAVPAPAGATRFERLLGDTGRDTGWSPS
ncbi:hypothetical protein ACGFYT_13095 [Streptomyces sp. NPDC048208]|uniref:hypothetical protein n=1 Tax=unclassified Streptomyces TaxID=2593676 RepID=UPI0033D52D68